jgi:hypothetical protein
VTPRMKPPAAAAPGYVWVLGEVDDGIHAPTTEWFQRAAVLVTVAFDFAPVPAVATLAAGLTPPPLVAPQAGPQPGQPGPKIVWGFDELEDGTWMPEATDPVPAVATSAEGLAPPLLVAPPAGPQLGPQPGPPPDPQLQSYSWLPPFLPSWW